MFFVFGSVWLQESKKKAGSRPKKQVVQAWSVPEGLGIELDPRIFGIAHGTTNACHVFSLLRVPRNHHIYLSEVFVETTRRKDMTCLIMFMCLNWYSEKDQVQPRIQKVNFNCMGIFHQSDLHSDSFTDVQVIPPAAPEPYSSEKMFQLNNEFETGWWFHAYFSYVLAIIWDDINIDQLICFKWSNFDHHFVDSFDLSTLWSTYKWFIIK